MLFKELLEYYKRLKNTSSRNEKINIIIQFFHRLKPNEAEIGVNFIQGRLRQGRLSLGWKGVSQLLKVPGRSSNPPGLIEIDRYLDAVKSARGRKKIKVLVPLFGRLTTEEQQYLVSLILQDLQQGAGEGIVKVAIARYFRISDAEIEEAYLYNPDLGKIFTLLAQKGRSGIGEIGIKIFVPVKPMLAQISDSIPDLFRKYRDFGVEYKLDGVRIQVHKKYDRVRIFSRNLKDITSHFPELVDIVKTLQPRSLIIDGEAVGMDTRGRVVPFQVLARRTTRKKDLAMVMKDIPVIPKFFDILYINGDTLTAEPYEERLRILKDVVREGDYLAHRKVPGDVNEAEKFFIESVRDGNEGIMIKLLGSPYRPGRRGGFWFKIKRAYTLDCVILAAEWGHGRRRGWLSNLHLGVLDETGKKFLMVGKTFKGLTDQMLQWFTDVLPKYKIHEDRWTIYVKPAVVVEVEFNGVQKSSKYDSKFALRFARVKRIRYDKGPFGINTILDLEKILKRR